MLGTRGFSLVELSIGMLMSLSLVVFATAGATKLREALTHLQQQIVVNNELRLLTQTVGLQLRRSGYIAISMDKLLRDLGTLSFPPSPTIGHHPDEPENSCVLFAYDKNSDGIISAHAPAEKLGFRLRSHALEYRVAERTCEQGGWHDMSDTEAIVVTAFSIEPFAIGHQAQVYQLHLEVKSKSHQSVAAQRSFFVGVPNAF